MSRAGYDPKVFDLQSIFPKVKDFYQIVLTGASACQVRNGDDVVINFEGKDVHILLKVLRFLDGSKSLQDIKQELERVFDIPGDVSQSLLASLLEKGILEDGHSSDSLTAEEVEYYTDELAFLSRYSVNKYGYFSVAREKKVGVLGLSKVGFSVVRGLATLGVGSIQVLTTAKDVEHDPVVLEPGRRNDKNLLPQSQHVSIVCQEVDEFTPEILQAFVQGGRNDVIVLPVHYFENIEVYEMVNELCVKSKIPFVGGYVQGDKLEIGPFVVPGVTACYHCFSIRRKANNPSVEFLQQFEDACKQQSVKMVRRGEPGIFCSLLGNILALEVYKFLMGFAQPATFDKLVQINPLTLESNMHHILKLPRCPVCYQRAEKPRVNLWTVPLEETPRETWFSPT